MNFEEILRKKKATLRAHFLNLHIKSETVEMLTGRVFPTGSARALQLPGMQDWRAYFWQGCLDACQPEGKGALLKIAWNNPYFLKLIGASTGCTGGSAGVVAGIGGTIAGGVLTATGIGAPIGVPLMVAGIVTALLGMGATVSGASGIAVLKKKKKKR